MTIEELREVVRNWVATAAQIAGLLPPEDGAMTEPLNAVIENLVEILRYSYYDPDNITDVLEAYSEHAADFVFPFDDLRKIGRFVDLLASLAPSNNVRPFRDGPERIFNRIIGNQP